jgi:hypothetical protein
MEGGMPDYARLRTKDLGQEALSADNVHGNARAKAVRTSYEFWSTGDEALLEQAFAEIFAEHRAAAVRDGHNWIGFKPASRGVGKGL